MQTREVGIAFRCPSTPLSQTPVYTMCMDYANTGNNVQRQFCGNCGSPIFSKSPKYPGMSIFKAMLFEELAPPSMEVFTGSRVEFVKPIEGAEQA